MIAPIRVLLSDDHAVLRAGLRALLNVEPDIEVVGEASNGAEALRQVEVLQPNVVVMDLTMPGTSGLEAIRYISRHFPRVRSLVLTMHSEEQFIIGTIRAGGAGYVMKSAADVELIQAIRQVNAGENYFTGPAMQLLLDYHRNNKAEPERADALSEREYEVLVLTVQGYSSREIGERLIISAKTVDTYRQRVMQKLGLNHRVDLVQYAVSHGLLDSASDDSVNRRELAATGDICVHPAESTVWNRFVDLIVVGSGTGLMAALRAAAGGLNVLVIEKADHVGGTMGISGGGLWIPNNYRMRESGIEDSAAEAVEYIRHATLGQSDPQLAAAFVEQCNGAIEFLRDIGVQWDFQPIFNDYYPHFPGGKPRGRTLRPVNGRGEPLAGAELTQLMLDSARRYGVSFALNTAAKRLIVNDDGAVTGVVAESDGKTYYFKARYGVILAAGGFDHNEAMVRNFLRGPLYYTSAVPTDTGDGHMMGMALGASLRNMNERWGWPVFYDTDQQVSLSALATELGRPSAIVVNKLGQRILNEAGPYDSVARAFFSFDTGTYEYFNIPSYAIIDSQHRSRYTFAAVPPGARMPEWVKQADTLRDLAAMIGVDSNALEITIAHFNANAEKGVDPEFHRGESDFDLLTAGDLSRDDLINPCLAPILEPPFYAAAIWPGALGTSGGLQTNTFAQVLNVWGKIIPGLYAVGNTAASPLAGGYPGGGGTLSAGLTFAFIASNYVLTQRDD